MRRAVRILGTLLVAGGLGTLAWAGVTWAWADPFTAVYTRLEQRELEQRYEERLDQLAPEGLAVAHEPRPPAAAPTGLSRSQRADLRAVAARYRTRLGEGDAVGRLRVPRLGLEMMIVEGTRSATLKRGPGRYRGSKLPGEGHLIYVAGHRTTYSAPFSRIDRLRPGDLVVVEVPYGTFEYRVRGHTIVRADALRVLRTRGREEVALQACHPRFFASHRYIVYATPVRVRLGETAYLYDDRRSAAGDSDR